MKRTLFGVGILFLAIIAPLRADELIASAQQSLKDQGFYYGEITGRKDPNTTASIRRYQIRNGLKITGELNTETQRSLRITGTRAKLPRIASQQQPSDDNADVRDDDVQSPQPPSRRYYSAPHTAPQTYSSEPDRYRQDPGEVFYGTPYEGARFDIQQRVVTSAQIFLARRGYYRSEIDGIYGPGTEFALRAFQSGIGLPVSGRLDLPTLRTLGLMPGHNVPARHFRPNIPPRPVYRGQWIPG